MNIDLKTFISDLADALGERAQEALLLLRRRDGADRPKEWRAEILAWLEHTPGIDLEAAHLAPTVHPEALVVHGRTVSKIAYGPRTEGQSLLLWLQKLRRDMGERAESFSHTPLWKHARRYFEAAIKRLLQVAEVPRSAWKDEAAAYKRQLHPGLLSSTHLPALELMRRADELLLDLQIRGAGAVRDAWLERQAAAEEKEQAKEEQEQTRPRGWSVRWLCSRGATRQEATEALDLHLPGLSEIPDSKLLWLAGTVLGLELDVSKPRPKKAKVTAGAYAPKPNPRSYPGGYNDPAYRAAYWRHIAWQRAATAAEQASTSRRAA